MNLVYFTKMARSSDMTPRRMFDAKEKFSS